MEVYAWFVLGAAEGKQEGVADADPELKPNQDNERTEEVDDDEQQEAITQSQSQ